MSGGIEDTQDRPPFRFLDHWGMISGGFLALLVLAFLVILAALGDPSALAVLVVIVAGVFMIYLLGRLRGSGRHG